MLYFVIHYFLKIIVFLVENLLYISYIEMASDLFKEVGKYLCFGMSRDLCGADLDLG